MNRKPQPSSAQQQRAREQQAVLNQLRAGKGISGARPANPFIGALQNLTGVGAGAVPTLYGAALGGQEVLLGKGGWNKTTAATGPINVGGQTWYPAQSGQDLVYKRAPGNVGGQYGSIFSADQAATPAAPGSQPPAPGGTRPPSVQPPVKLSPEEQAYNAERSRIAQLTAQNPEFQNVGQLRNDLRDQGMAIWAAKYGGPGGLASKVKPGAVGYDAIQRGIGIQSIPSLENRAEFGLDQLTQGPTPAVPMADEMLNPASPGFIGGEGAPPMNFADPRFENMSPEDFQKLLNQVNRK
jgi:hypothetical protein